MSNWLLVIASFGFDVLCVDEHSENPEAIIRCKSLQSKQRPVTGDQVRLKGSSVVAVKPRVNQIQRLRNKQKLSTIAANVDLLGIVISHEPYVPWRFIDTWLVVAWVQKIKPVLILNKCDVKGFDAWKIRFLERYPDPLFQHWSGSAISGVGIDELKTLSEHKKLLFVGASGVGKSSLSNALIPGLSLKTQMLSTYNATGKHTTSNTFLHRIPAHTGSLIDSPGVRALDIELPELFDQAWVDFQPFLGQCKFRNCIHEKEPGCAIVEAVMSGQIHPDRYENYLNLKAHLGRLNPWESQ